MRDDGVITSWLLGMGGWVEEDSRCRWRTCSFAQLSDSFVVQKLGQPQTASCGFRKFPARHRLQEMMLHFPSLPNCE